MNLRFRVLLLYAALISPLSKPQISQAYADHQSSAALVDRSRLKIFVLLLLKEWVSVLLGLPTQN
jgi:hypothetical protein